MKYIKHIILSLLLLGVMPWTESICAQPKDQIQNTFTDLVDAAKKDTSKFDQLNNFYHNNKTKLDSSDTHLQLTELSAYYKQKSMHRLSSKVKTMLAWHYAFDGHLDAAKTIFREQIDAYSTSTFSDIKGDLYTQLMFIHNRSNDQDSTLFCYHRAVNAYEEDNNLNGLISAHKYGAQMHRLWTQPEKALEILSEVDSLCILANDSLHTADYYIELGLNYALLNRYIQAIQSYSEALKIYTSLQDSEGISITNLNLGNVFLAIKDYEMAQKTYQSALNEFKRLDAQNDLAMAYNNISLVSYHLENYHHALAYLDSAFNLTPVINNEPLKGDIFTNQGLCYMDLEKYDSAIVKLESALQIENKVGDHFGIALCHINLYNCYFLSGDSLNTAKYQELAMATAKKGIDLRLEFDLYHYLSTNYLQLGDTSNALKYQLKLSSIKDSLYDMDRASLLTALKNNMDYQSVKTSLSQTQKKLTSETQQRQQVSAKNAYLKSKNRTITYLSMAVALSLLSLIAVLLISIKRKKTMNQLLSEQASQLEQQNRDILSSAEYAKSMEKMLTQQMNPHFIFNALTTVEASISINDSDFTKQYIQNLSRVLRSTLDHSRESAIPLSSEIKYLKDYINLHQFKTHRNIHCTFIYDEDEVEDFVNTPPMLIQPFVENALMHGLYHKTNGVKELTIKISPKEDHILWIIEDNGVGRKEAARISKTHTGTSHGANIIADRIKWLRNLHKKDFSIAYEDLDQGTRVTLKTPIII